MWCHTHLIPAEGGRELCEFKASLIDISYVQDLYAEILSPKNKNKGPREINGSLCFNENVFLFTFSKRLVLQQKTLINFTV